MQTPRLISAIETTLEFDIGISTSAALHALRQAVPAEAAGGTDERSNGNGSLMRILPLALVERDVAEQMLVDHAHRSSAITHGHAMAQASCALYVLVARHLMNGHGPTAALEEVQARLRALYADRPDADARQGPRGSTRGTARGCGGIDQDLAG